MSSSEADDSIGALSVIFGEVRDLLRSNLQTSSSSHASIAVLEKLLLSLTDNQRSGATDRLDTQAVRAAYQEKRQDSMEESLVGIVTRVDKLTRMVEEQHRWSMPWWERRRRRMQARKEWREGRK